MTYRTDSQVTRHVVVHRDESGAYVAHAWNRRTGNWERERGLFEGAIRLHALAYLAPLAQFTNVAITERCIDYDELEGIGLADFDACAFYEQRTTLCPEGIPTMLDEWVSISLGFGAASISTPHRFPKVSITDRFQDASFHQPGTPEAPTVLVRHGIAARDLVSKERWGVVGRPDLTAKAIDEELRRRWEDEEATRRLIAQPGGFDTLRRQQRIAQQKKADRAGAR